MTQEKITEISIELRKKLFNDLKDFWLSNEGYSIKEIFFINSVVFSSLLAQVSFMMFKKTSEESRKHSLDYIDQVADFAKQQLNNFDLIKEMGIQ